MIGLEQKEAESTQSTLEKSLKTKLEKTVENFADLRTGHEAYMLDKIQKQNQLVLDQGRAQLKELYGDSIPDNGEGDTVGVSVGNEIHYHQPPKKSNALVTGALVASTLLGGGGLAALGISLLSKAGQEIVDTDTDTINEVSPGFGKPQDVNP